MKDYSEDFGPFDGTVWLNCAHQGALPKVAVSAAEEAIAWKVCPSKMTTERFAEVPLKLRLLLAQLIGASPDDVILANSASYGLHLLANGIPWAPSDEVLLSEGDFPADILPWLGLRDRGVKVRFVKPRRYVIQPDELLANATPATRLLCITWVHSFSGFVANVNALGEICRSKNIRLVLNVSQALGARVFSVSSTPVDAVVGVGFKWLCGPYGTGFAWIDPSLRESLIYNQAYWLTMQTADELGKPQGIPTIRENLGARQFDVFGTANFFNFKPLAASIAYLLNENVAEVEAYDQTLVGRFIDGLDTTKYELISPREESKRSTLIFISHKDAARNSDTYRQLSEEGIFVAYRTGMLRFSPHLYNTEADIDRALDILNSN